MSNLIDIKVPDIGDFKDVPVIEVFVNIGDSVKAEDPLVSLESDKATMDVPAPHGGVVTAIPIKVGDKVSEGSVIMRFQANGGNGAAAPMPELAKPSVSAPPSPVSAPVSTAPVAAAPTAASGIDEQAFALAYAGPAVRKLARELGLDLGKVQGSGDHGRIVRADVEAFAKGGAAAAPKTAAAAPSASGVGGIDLLPWPKVDFAKFGPIERKDLSRI